MRDVSSSRPSDPRGHSSARSNCRCPSPAMTTTSRPYVATSGAQNARIASMPVNAHASGTPARRSITRPASGWRTPPNVPEQVSSTTWMTTRQRVLSAGTRSGCRDSQLFCAAHVLAVVERDQRVGVLEAARHARQKRRAALLADAERAGQSVDRCSPAGQVGQLAVPRAVAVAVSDPATAVKCEDGFADPSDTDERRQPSRRHALDRSANLAGPTQQRTDRHTKASRARRPSAWDSVGESLSLR
jgi:hypothetical protein